MATSRKKKSDQVAKFLGGLKKSGAVVRRRSSRGTAITSKVLNDLKTSRSPSFDAWVTWTLRF